MRAMLVAVPVTVIVQMIGAFDITAARQYENVAGGVDHVDRRAIEL